MSYEHLNSFERKAIYYRFNSGESCRSIGKLLNRHHTTIMREVKRNKPPYYDYFDEAAHEKAMERRKVSRHARKRNNKALYELVLSKIAMGWSPDAIAGRFKKDNPSDELMHVSHETIYQWVIKDFKAGGELYKDLAKRHKKRRKQRKYGDLRGQIKNRVSISERPKIVEDRSRIGDWEGDLIEGKKGSGFFVTHVDRSSRYLIAQKIETKQAESFNTATVEMFKEIPEHKQLTLTLDNGKEFSKFKALEEELDFIIYFADPYCSWQRGTNEHTNGLIRRYFPKKTDFSTITNEQLQEVVMKINTRPRKILNYQTAEEVFIN
ncbi:IS30 family transposase [Pseudoalteromonas sp. 1_2015MBL_MicDiv]|uniref:IS30 family transposase n=1 Tax=Pseudoalteromonas sp. 1_2015MBL_MicDiv TaxID=1720343 RepID=UPI000BBE6B9F|nr:IS30 family transposase [Pseudoalteromonas sp. 1_2015MBL_MicDiv]ATG79719.1 transposase [Pseudoalteromonas sp. 1_2015MBL_MicDiv]